MFCFQYCDRKLGVSLTILNSVIFQYTGYNAPPPLRMTLNMTYLIVRVTTARYLVEIAPFSP